MGHCLFVNLGTVGYSWDLFLLLHIRTYMYS